MFETICTYILSLYVGQLATEVGTEEELLILGREHGSAGRLYTARIK